jgi:DNA invertase Pin-like site-specific DNA recombinase
VSFACSVNFSLASPWHPARRRTVLIDPLLSAKPKPWHLDRLAMIYIRQSDPQQILDNRESTALQYALRDRALALGWPPDRILLLDGDQGKTAATAEGRRNFHYLLAEGALGHVGLILGREVSRSARNCKDWFPLLEMCSRFGTLLGDRDGLYDPTDPNDRLLLGIKGIMSEAELHLLKSRMNDAKLNKARRGELVNAAPIGYVKTPDSTLVIDPDEQVQATVRLIFEQFSRLGTAGSLLRYLVRNHIDLPVRSRRRGNRGELRWEEALKEQKRLQEEFDRWRQSMPSRLSAAECEMIRALAADLPAVWQAETTTAQDRKELARLLLERITVLVDKDGEKVDISRQWMGDCWRGTRCRGR